MFQTSSCSGRSREVHVSGTDRLTIFSLSLEVFMDLHMPVMNGIDAAREIRRLELEASASGARLRRDRMPIVLVSAGSDVAIDPELFDEALYKPVSRDRLRATLSVLLAESAQVTATART